jgi:signal transduction histidine kinase
MIENTLESQSGTPSLFSTESEWSQAVALAWAEVLSGVNPLMEREATLATVLPWAGELVSALLREPFDPAPGAEVGARFEDLESVQPGDLQRLQEALFPLLTAPLAAEDHGRAAALLFALGAGFFVAKAQRASQLDMSVQSLMSHDLKTPLNAITGFSRVILKGIDGPITDFQREDLTSIYEAGQRLLTMINEVFLVRKRDAARTLIYAQPYEVADLLADVARTVQPLAGEHQHTFELRMVGDLGEMAVDASTVRWILLTLIGYMIRQSSGSYIALSASREAHAADTLLFQVKCRPSSALRPYDDSAADAVPGAPEWSNAPEGSDEVDLLTCRRFCEQLGGSVVRVRNEKAAFQIRLPAVTMAYLE